MAGKTYTQKIQFQGSFDGAEVLSGLKKIRQSMSDAGADASLFKGVDKDIAATEKLINDMLAQIQKGFSNPKEVANFEKQLEKLGLSFSKINVGLQDINKASNFNLNADEVKKYTTELERLTNQQERLKQAAKDSVAIQLQSAKLNAKERKAIMDEVEANGDLEAAVKKVAQAKEKAAKAKHGTAALNTETGKSFISGVSGVGLDKLGVTAKSGHSKKGRNDARERNARGVLTGNIDETKANAAAIESYRKALEETIKTGGTAVDAIEAMKKAMDEYGLELGDTSKLLDSFDKDMQEFQATALSSSQRGAISRAQTLGSTNASGEFELSGAGQELANNAQYQAMRQNIDDIAESQENLNRATEEGTRQVERYIQEQTEGLNHSAQEQEHLEAAARESTDALKDQSETAQAVNDKFEDMKGAVKTFLSIGSAISGVKQVIQQTFNDIKELDKSFAEIAMVTEYSVQQMWQSYDQYAEMANKLGQSTQSVIQASGLFYQQGLDTEESLALTEDTMKLATLAGLDFAEATSQMTAALRGFHLEMDEGARVTDVYSELAAKAAADVQGIAYAMSKTASIASSAGMEFETTSAFLTQMIETTQEAPENIGTAMKTIIARFTELKENVAGTADSEFDDLDYNKVDTALKSVGVSLKDTNGQFRDLDDVFLELSQKWNTLDRNSQRYIATIAAGSRQQSRFIAMMENYDRTMELVGTAYDSAGRASEQFAKYQDTVEYKLNQLQNTWEQFRTQFFNSEFFKNIIDGLNVILGKITELSGGQLLGLGAAFVILGKTLVVNLISGAQTGVKKLGELISNKVQSIFNKVGKIQHYQVTVDIRKEQIKQLQQKLAELKNQKIEFESDNKDVLEDLKKIQEEIKKAKEEGRDLNFGDNAPSQGMIDRAEELNNLETQIDRTTDETNRQVELFGDEQQQLEDAQQRGEILGQTLATSMSAAIIAVTTQDNPMTAIGTVLAAGISGLLPTILPAIGTIVTAFKTGGLAAGKGALEGFITGSAGIGLIIVAITAALTGLFVLAKNMSKEREANKLTNQIDALNKKIEETEEKIQQTKSSLDNLNQTGDSLEELKKKWEALGSKQVLTTEEQEEYNSLIEQIKEEYPELITYYDEENNKMQISIGLLDEKIEKQNELIKAEQQLLNLQQRQLNSQTYDKDIKQTYKDLTKQGHLFENYSADMTEGQFESAFKGLSGDFITNQDYGYKSGYDIAEQFFEDQFLEEGSEQYMSGKAGEIATDYMRVAEMAKTQNMSVEEVLNLDSESLNSYLSEVVYGDYIENENGEYVKNAEEQAESIKNNVDALKEFNEQVLNATTAMEQVEKENFERQANLNAEIVAQELGIDANSAAANIIGAQAAALTSEMDAVTLTGESDGVAAGLDTLKTAMGDYADDIELTVDEFKALSKGVTQGHWAGANWKNISSSQRDNLKLLGIDAETWKNEYQDLDDEELSKKLAEAYSDYAQNAIAAAIGEGQEEKAEELNEAFTSLYSEIPEMTIEELNKKKEEFKNQYGDGLDNTQWEQTWNEMTNNDILSAAIDNLAASGLEQDIIDSLSTSTVQYFSGMLDSLSLTDLGRENLTDAIEQVSENYKLSNEQLETLLSIDLSQGYHEIQRNSETYINALMESGMYLSEATDAFNSYITDIGSILGNAILGQDGALLVKDMLQGDIKGFSDQYESLIEARNEMLDNEGTISSETYFALIEKGFEDYVKITTNGYELITEKAEEAWTAQAMAPLDELREDIKLNKQLLNEAQEMSQEDWTINEWQGNSNFSTYTINDAISRYLEDEKKFEGATNQLTQAQKKYIETIVAAGYTTEEEYIKALKEGTIALENMESDIYIQGLVNLSESMVNAAEKVNDLKEELEELNEQLEDDKTALAEAEDELRQAIHGSDDFQSSLDGLINYTGKIERLDKAIEKTKESLEDISNIDEAKGLMAQLNEQYKNKTITLSAENMAIDAALTNLRSTLTENYGDYISFDDEGNPLIDFAYMAMDANDEIRKAFEEEYNLYNEYAQKKTDNLDAIEEIEKEKQEQREQTLKDFVAIQEDVISILKEKAQEEIDVTKEKYDALEEADNNYLDALQEAIDKQRQLRDQENQYEDLATKEKKLALMQRDTSGANQKETQQLEKEIEDDRQQLLDNEVDNLIESMKELYDKQKEARDAEIEYMETVTENTQYFAEWASNIMSDWQSVDDMQAWYLENDPAAQDMTIEQTEVYLNEIGDKYSDYLQYIAVLATDFTTEQEELNSAITEMYENTETNVENIGTVTQEMAQTATDKAIEEATRARDEAKDKLDETQQKITETEQALKTAEDNAVSAHDSAMEAMIEASKEAMEEVSTYAAKQLIEFEAVDLQSSESVQEFAEKYNFYNKDTGEYSQSFVNALTDKGYDTSDMTVGANSWKIVGTPKGTSTTVSLFGGMTFDSKAEAEAYLQGHSVSDSIDPNTILPIPDWITVQKGAYKKYATGGLIDYTGPAWVDGTPNQPEAFLNPQDTARIGAAAELLANLPIFNSTSSADNAVSTNIGDTSIEIHINIDNISDDYDVDQMVERIKQDIVDVSKPIGTSVILNK